MIQITEVDLRAKVEEGWKKKTLAEHYGLPVAQMTRVLKDLGLTIRKFPAPKYEIIRDTPVVEELQSMEVATGDMIEEMQDEMVADLPDVDFEEVQEAYEEVEVELHQHTQIAETTQGETVQNEGQSTTQW